MHPHVFTVCTGQLIQLLFNVKFKTDVMDIEEGEAYFFCLCDLYGILTHLNKSKKQSYFCSIYKGNLHFTMSSYSLSFTNINLFA